MTMGADPVPDPKKRALDALERRFGTAKSSDPSQERRRRLGEKHDDRLGSSAGPSLPCSGDAETQGPAYFQLAQPVHSSLLTANFEFSSQKESMSSKIVRELFRRGDSAQKYLHGSKSIKFDNWILLDNVVQGRRASVDSRKKAMLCKSKRSRIHMSMRQHRKCGSLNIPKEFHKFDLFIPMYEMWNDYVTKLLGNSGNNQICRAILEADLHGAILLVVECKVVAFVRISGIMIRETAETFGIITRQNKFQVVPKKGSVFMLQVSCWKITLYGDKLCSRNNGN